MINFIGRFEHCGTQVRALYQLKSGETQATAWTTSESLARQLVPLEVRI